MLTGSVLKTAGAVRVGAIHVRNIGVLAPAMAKASDPIQQLFIDKIKAYKPSKPDPNSKAGKALASEMQKLCTRYNLPSEEAATQFPAVKFNEPTIDTTSVAK